jgi:hypothetical protein
MIFTKIHEGENTPWLKGYLKNRSHDMPIPERSHKKREKKTPK